MAAKTTKRLIIVSNRLPVSIARGDDGSIKVTQSVGGLATGLSSFHGVNRSVWVGWPGIVNEDFTPAEREEIRNRLAELNCIPVFLSSADMEGYYNGFCNQTLWPLFHYFPQYARYRDSDWEAYQRVNRAFAEVCLSIGTAEDVFWVHDYHLMLLPGLLRERLRRAAIGYFLHIPFPSSEILRLLPWREELLEQLLGSDLIGFHTYDYTRHFLASVSRILGFSPVAIGRSFLPVGDRIVRVDAFPMGIDYERYVALPSSDEIERIQKMSQGRRMILSIDRLDYSKGMLHRLDAYEEFLAQFHEYREKVVLVLKAIESRSGIQRYADLKRKLDERVGKVNGRFGTLDWVPVIYLFRFLPEETLLALYRLAEVALLTPLRDGMNLIAKEFLAAKSEEDGVLILSEMAGAEQELREALIVNPNDRQQIVDALAQALEMPLDERKLRNSPMRERIRRFGVVRWAEEFIRALDRVRSLQQGLETKRINDRSAGNLIERFERSTNRLLLLDFDGTLVPLAEDPARVTLPRGTLRMLDRLSKDPNTSVVVLSGRTRKQLDSLLGESAVRRVAEHGIWHRQPLKEWEMVQSATSEWKNEVRSLLDWYVDRTPGTTLVEKEYSLFWDYRRADEAFARVREGELKEDLLPLLRSYSLRMLEGGRFLEVKSANVSQGEAARRVLSERDWDFVLAAGDDVSDEEVFQVLPDHAVSIRVGRVVSRAEYSVESPRVLVQLLNQMAATCPSDESDGIENAGSEGERTPHGPAAS